MLNKFKILSLLIFLNVFGSAQDAGTSNAISDPVLLRRAFIDAVEANDLRRVQEIVPTHLRPDEEVFGGATSLVYAVRSKSVVIVRYLLKQGARSNIENRRENGSPLAMALRDQCSNTDIAALLLENGAIPNQKDKDQS